VENLTIKLPAAAYSAEVATSATKAGSCGVSCEILRPVGQSLWAACRSRYPPSPRLRRVLLAFIPAAAYSAEAATSATKAGRYGVFGEGESSRTLAPGFSIPSRDWCRNQRRVSCE
jgi:hypothetical protein